MSSIFKLPSWIMMLCICLAYKNMLIAEQDTYWDKELVRPYVHHSELQRRWALNFLAAGLKDLHGNESILDIGCGDGKITADLSRFIQQGQIIGIDPSLAMLNWAKKQYDIHEYPNVCFQEGSFELPNVDGPFDVIISNCALQHSKDISQAFKTMARFLKPGGQLWIMTPAIDNLAWKKAISTVKNRSQWKSFWTNTRPRKFLNEIEYADLLEANGFSALSIKKINSHDPFIDRNEFLSFLLGTFRPAAPKNLRADFFNEVIDEYIQLAPDCLKSNGVIEARFSRIEVKAIKAGKPL